ncbi:DUF397 domain-containing protein [Streptomyces sp. NA02950]|uniref:DUF397 domain-containing protein n=1 Tax=Streptomyces sp. NA02950 TaxID=2742137 RepID=UPI0015909348|nr:DUF397 domain-containing protein [Streptomyces sp. NA02950]QKV93524.1 DUF397 domain-containing protein [Streptomyces sp. NA02950]
MTEIPPLMWHKSSYSNGAGGNCVESARHGGDRTAVRDSKDPGGPVLAFSDRAWGDFIAAVRGRRLG